MIVYVESNFVLAIALGQEDAAPATAILESGERHDVTIAFPMLALSEPFSTVTHRGRERRRLGRTLNDHIRELGRSQPHQSIVTMLRPVPSALADLETREIDLLQATVRSLLGIGRLLPFNVSVFDRALASQRRYGLSPQDAMIYAAVVSDREAASTSQRACFVSKNWKDFGHRGIAAELRSVGCVFAESFETAVRIIEDWTSSR